MFCEVGIKNPWVSFGSFFAAHLEFPSVRFRIFLRPPLRTPASASPSTNFASPPTKPRRPETGIIAPVGKRIARQSTKIGQFTAAGLTRGPLDYLIRASAAQAQVAQSVEQRTENPRVGGSIPPLATTQLRIFSGIYRFPPEFHFKNPGSNYRKIRWSTT